MGLLLGGVSVSTLVPAKDTGGHHGAVERPLFPDTPQVTLSGLDTPRVLSDLLLLSVPEKTELLPHFSGEETKGQGS